MSCCLRRHRVRHIPSFHMIRKTFIFERSRDQPASRWDAVGSWDYEIALTEPIQNMVAYICPELTENALQAALFCFSWRADSSWLAEDHMLGNGIRCRFEPVINSPGHTLLSLRSLYLNDVAKEEPLPDLLYCYLVIR